MGEDYLKAAEKRTPGWQMAFLLITKIAQQVNQIIWEDLIIEGKHIFACKDILEPRRCLKCQGYQRGHMAAACKHIHDICVQCRECIGPRLALPTQDDAFAATAERRDMQRVTVLAQHLSGRQTGF